MRIEIEKTQLEVKELANKDFISVEIDSELIAKLLKKDEVEQLIANYCSIHRYSVDKVDDYSIKLV